MGIRSTGDGSVNVGEEVRGGVVGRIREHEATCGTFVTGVAVDEAVVSGGGEVVVDDEF